MITVLLAVFFKYLREHFFITKNGFINGIFNVCCKYNVIDFWHGKLKGLTNPTSFIKDKILSFSLKNDLSIGRKRSCAFSDICLTNLFSYQKTYHLVEPFLKQDFFTSASARCLVTRFLLQSQTFFRKCYFCSLELKDIISHQLFSCTKLEDKRRLLRSKFVLYNFPANKLNNKITFYMAVLSKRIWTKCLSEFLADIDPRNQSQT